jgi:4-hydroxy-3-methylbut-2-en-1-yl diphosphate synthase IspG/GcpE
MFRFKAKKCEYCNPVMSYGNKAIYVDKEVDIYIAKDILFILKEPKAETSKVKIKYCPMCGRKTKEMEG